MKKSRLHAAVLATMLIAAAVRMWVLSTNHIPFNADESIVALMARHILQGHRPIFFYGQAYMGSLDAILVSRGFQLMGERVEVIRWIQSLLFLGTVGTTALLAGTLFDSWKAALYAGLLFAVPQVNVVLYTTVSLGGYGEMLLLGNLQLLTGYALITKIQNPQPCPIWPILVGVFLWGVGAGFAFWVIGLSLVFTIPMAMGLIWAIWSCPKRTLLCSGFAALPVGFLAGSLPWWHFALSDGGWTVIKELLGSAIADANTGNVFLEPFIRLVHMLVFGGTVVTGLRPPWDVRWLMLPLMPGMMIFWLVVLFHSLQTIRKRSYPVELVILAGMSVVLAAGFVLTPYGDDPSGRYFLPLAVPMAIFASKMILDVAGGKLIWESGLLIFVLAFNFGGLCQSLGTFPPGLTTQFDRVTQIDHRQINSLIGFLRDQGITRGYTNYWVSYPLAFLSGEELIFIPRLPYHQDFRYTARDDRYPPYTELVDAADEVAYITTNHPDLDQYLREKFTENDISWQEQAVGDYRIFYRLTRSIQVQEIGLGSTTTP